LVSLVLPIALSEVLQTTFRKKTHPSPKNSRKYHDFGAASPGWNAGNLLLKTIGARYDAKSSLVSSPRHLENQNKTRFKKNGKK